MVSTTTLTVDEGSSNTFTVQLAAQPESNVTVTVARTSGDGDLNVTGGSSLMFTTGNWNIPQAVTVNGAEDPDASNGSATIAASSPGLTSQLVTASEIDNDLAGFIVSKSTASVSESGTSDIFSIVLTAQPLANVVLEVTSGNLGEVSVSPAQLTFTSANWNAPQFVTVAGVNDNPATVDGSQAVTVTVSVNGAASDDAWDPLAVPITTAA